jgi:hypothetical protein
MADSFQSQGSDEKTGRQSETILLEKADLHVDAAEKCPGNNAASAEQ